MPEGARAEKGPPGLRDWPGFQLQKCGAFLQLRLDEELSKLGVGLRPFLVLTMLEARTDLSQQEMAAYLSLAPTLMVALVDELEIQGLCKRGRNPSDRRRSIIALTPAGRRLLARARPVADAVAEEVFAPLAKSERRQLGELIARVMEPYWEERERSAQG